MTPRYLDDQWEPATRDIVIATKSPKRFWDDLATRKPYSETTQARFDAMQAGRQVARKQGPKGEVTRAGLTEWRLDGSGAPLLDYWKPEDFNPEPGAIIMGNARFIVADVFDGLATLEDDSVDLIVTSPPFLALRSYLPADHPDKSKEIGSESTPAEFLDVLLRVTAEWRRVLAPHGSIAVELGDTYAGSGGAGGDYGTGGLHNGQPKYGGSAERGRTLKAGDDSWRDLDGYYEARWVGTRGGAGWPLAKSKTLIPELYRLALAYGFNPLTGEESPAGRWLVRNVVTWCRPNPPVGALGDKWRPATSDVVVAAKSPKRFWDDLATRKPYSENSHPRVAQGAEDRYDLPSQQRDGNWSTLAQRNNDGAGAPLLDYWEIPPGGYKGSHYAVFPPELVVPLVKAMCPQKVCRVCGEPSRRIVETMNAVAATAPRSDELTRRANSDDSNVWRSVTGDTTSRIETLGFTDCGHDDYRPGLVLDPFAGSGTTLMVAHGHGFDTIGIDLDERNAELALQRVGPMFLEVEA